MCEELDEIREDHLAEECEEYLNAQALLQADDEELGDEAILLREELEAEYGYYIDI